MQSITKLGKASKKTKGGKSPSEYMAASEYYHDKGEKKTNSRWQGELAKHFKLSGAVDRKKLDLMALGYHPDSKGKPTPLGKSHGDEHMVGFDITYSPPKSVSDLYVIADDEIKQKIIDCLHEANTKTLKELEKNTYTRTGKGGKNIQKVKGMAAASYLHFGSRNLDPQLHIHNFIPNVVMSEDGKFRTIESFKWMEKQKYFSAYFDSVLANELKDKLGVDINKITKYRGQMIWDYDEKQEVMLEDVQLKKDMESQKTLEKLLNMEDFSYEIDGIDIELIKATSTRRQQIEKVMDEKGLVGSEQAEKIALKTRVKKEEPEYDKLLEVWEARFASFGYPKEMYPELLNKILNRPKKEEKEIDVNLILERFADKNSWFTYTQLVEKVLRASVGKLSVEEAEEKAQQIMKSKDVVILGEEGDKIFLTTPEILRMEKDMAMNAYNRRNHITHKLTEKAVQDSIDKINKELAAYGGKLNEQQDKAVKYITQETGGYSIIEGMAGAGKTTMLKAVRIAYQSQGFRVLGCALAGKASSGLEIDAGIPSYTIDKMLTMLKQGTLSIQTNDVIVMDEAGMTSTKKIYELTKHIEAVGAKLVMVGDSKQLQPINAGAPFKLIGDTIGRHELSIINRQKVQWMNDAVHMFSRGENENAFQMYYQNGLLKVKKEEEDAFDEAAKLYCEDVSKAIDKIAIAGTKQEVATINKKIREKLQESGYLSKNEVEIFIQKTGVRRTFTKNDRIIFLANEYEELKVKNGQLGTIEEVVMRGSIPVFKIRLDSGSVVEVDTSKYNALDHSFCITCHASQGVSIDNTVIYKSSMANRNWMYVAMSRHKKKCNLVGVESYDESQYEKLQKDLNEIDKKILQARKDKKDGEVDMLLKQRDNRQMEYHVKVWDKETKKDATKKTSLDFMDNAIEEIKKGATDLNNLLTAKLKKQKQIEKANTLVLTPKRK